MDGFQILKKTHRTKQRSFARQTVWSKYRRMRASAKAKVPG